MDDKLFDLYSDYLLSSFAATTATGMSALMDNTISHDQVSRMLNGRKREPQAWWQMVKSAVRTMQGEEGVITIDDSIVEKPYTDENELICWHYDHAQGQLVKGINFITALYTVGEVSLPVTYRLVTKTESYIDKQGKRKRRSCVTKNEHFRAMLQNCVRNRIPCRYVLNDVWFASAENMSDVKTQVRQGVYHGAQDQSQSRPLPTRQTRWSLSQTEPTRLARKHSDRHLSGTGIFPPSICSVRPAQTQMARPLCAIW